MTSKETLEDFTIIAKYFLLPLFVSYILGTDVLIICQMWRETITLMIEIFSLNALMWWNIGRKKLENE